MLHLSRELHLHCNRESLVVKFVKTLKIELLLPGLSHIHQKVKYTKIIYYKTIQYITDIIYLLRKMYSK